ncbi:MAG: hypothetical protein FWG11_02190, partial [Promicromonosporaceae bacterium]|nr:hypothetical protein [Promicromonosporaceae bacterium]
ALLTWIANVNQDRGLGGITIFILYQILLTAVSNRDSFLQNLHSPDAARVLIPVGVACLIVIAMGVFLGNSEYRMKVNKVSIDNGFTGQSYLPIKLNPAGASPIMYAMALLSLPQTIIGAFAIIIPSFAPTAHSLLNNWGLSTLPGFLTYLVLLFAMSVFWGLMNVRPHKLAEQMQDAGEYLDSVAPGKETRRHIRNRVLVLASLTGVGLIVLTGLPLYFMAGNPQFQYELMMPGTLMILIALMWVVYEEIADTAIGRKYRFELLSTTGGAK